LVVMQRGGYHTEFNCTITAFLNDARVASAEQLRQCKSGKVLFVETAQHEISSSAIRARIKNGGSLTEWVLPEVIHYIEEHALYL
jgi:nicotinic acid mononucleotide adenylyltransferase